MIEIEIEIEIMKKKQDISSLPSSLFSILTFSLLYLISTLFSLPSTLSDLATSCSEMHFPVGKDLFFAKNESNYSENHIRRITHFKHQNRKTHYIFCTFFAPFLHKNYQMCKIFFAGCAKIVQKLCKKCQICAKNNFFLPRTQEVEVYTSEEGFSEFFFSGTHPEHQKLFPLFLIFFGPSFL